MSEQTKVKELVSAAMDKVHEMADANTILGDPVKVDRGITIIPITKVAYGFASGGSGAGITFTPLGFLVISDGKVDLLQMKLNYGKNSTVIDMVPEVFDKVAGLFNKNKSDDALERHNEKVVTEAATEAVAEAEKGSDTSKGE
ncbi:MAG: sporulation protein YtfJ [Oscillospiraceae bacterium]|nr:sporulation protein YtfJ [Oscillospiraceae bacterium]